MLCARCIRRSLSVSKLPIRTILRRNLTSITLTRPRLPAPTSSTSATPSRSVVPLLTPSTTALDLVPRISSHPALQSLQVRNGPRATFNPSHRVRKRRHGFLSRIKSRTGRMILKRRKLKKRNTLSH